MNKDNWTDDELLSRLVKSKTGKSRWDYIIILRKRPSKELFLKCVVLTKSKAPKTRKIGIDILAQMGFPRPFLKQTLKLYFNLLDTENDPQILKSILHGIGHNNDNLSKTQIEKLCLFSESNNKFVKEGLVSALGFIDNVKVVETLLKLSQDKIYYIRDWATFYIAQGKSNNKTVREALWARVNDKHQETKLEAIAGLAKRKDPRVIEIIKRELINEEYGTLLFDAIIETGNKEFLPLLKQNLKSIKKDHTIAAEWKKDLEACIKELTHKTK